MVKFIFDFGSPNAYLSHRAIPAIEQRMQLRFDYVPVLLGGIFKATGNRSPIEAFAGIPSKLAYDRLEMRRFIDAHSITNFVMNPYFPVNTLPMMRGAVAAKGLGVFASYVDHMFADMWERGLKMDDPAVFRHSLESAGLPADEILERINRDEVKQELADNTRAAVEAGVFGIPSFLVGQELFFGKDRLESVERACRRLQARGTDA